MMKIKKAIEAIILGFGLYVDIIGFTILIAGSSAVSNISPNGYWVLRLLGIMLMCLAYKINNAIIRILGIAGIILALICTAVCI